MKKTDIQLNILNSIRIKTICKSK